MPDLPTTASADPDARSAARKQAQRSHALDEFIAEELSTAPIAEPSIGSTIAASGRVVKTARDRKEEAERREYEESNFVRLPQLSKKELRDKRKRTTSRDTYAGEDWSTFAGDLDRLTRSVEKDRGQKLLEKSRKRKAEEEDEVMPRRKIGEAFKKRKGNLRRKRV